MALGPLAGKARSAPFRPVWRCVLPAEVPKLTPSPCRAYLDVWPRPVRYRRFVLLFPPRPLATGSGRCSAAKAGDLRTAWQSGALPGCAAWESSPMVERACRRPQWSLPFAPPGKSVFHDSAASAWGYRIGGREPVILPRAGPGAKSQNYGRGAGHANRRPLPTSFDGKCATCFKQAEATRRNFEQIFTLKPRRLRRGVSASIPLLP
jgi:hypothetical protein